MIKSGITLCALGLLLTVTAAAQVGHPLGAQQGALGGRFVSQGLSRPLGGIAPKDPPPYNGPAVYWYSYPVYVPVAVQSPAPPPAPAPQPVIINQYFSSPVPVERPVAAAQPAPLSHYLIAYRDHTVCPANDWWIEGDVLHYITPKDIHNQASLSLIDLELTTKLNRK